MRKLLVISGIPIDDLNMDEALDRLETFVNIGRATGKTHQIATINADFIVKSLDDPELRYLLQEADMATADGMPLVWGARMLGVPLEGRVTGADLVPALAQRSAQRGFSLYLLGAAPGVAALAGELLQAQCPGLKIVGAVSPPYSSVLETDPAVLEDIKKAKPDILLVAFGNPKQEKWIGMYGRELGVPVMIGVGGTLDFIAGKTRRAPEWMQKTGLEWVYRLVQEPGRLWKRYVHDLSGFSSFFLRQWWAMRQGRTIETILPSTEMIQVENTVILSPQGRLDLNNYGSFAEKAQQAVATGRQVIINMSSLTFLDSAAIGLFVGLTKSARDHGQELWLAGIPEPIMKTLTLLRLHNFFAIVPDVDSGFAAQKTRTTAPTSEPQGKWTITQIPHRLDATTAAEVIEAGKLSLQQNPYLVLDFSQTVFLASAGLAAIAQLNRLAQESGGEVRVAGCSAEVMRTLELVRFDRVVPLYEDVAAALA
ncbi:MAG: WecB/TagA/CpsF family glycosyltransferase [Anaerolineales bacterium]|nr:WecB/TagA/CpsF family glycosyltransferase [Anaerolineales bacterium]MCB8961362.1 WecB/TagA/CpsF family glycosyltransferase [Ardenticatenales bacterium]MCB0005479.1 WecB/TagA/CpsF family glycosyltransferase [Anaerolineales bacterium]MCB0011743.1 WecB/TagA/CpsF family glycosyltransferase [Anaerolineales bacterium]MCB0018568.1 WecB/TagA/CpsF family glycosyltransferase [Anaerolineales bacterium]